VPGPLREQFQLHQDSMQQALQVRAKSGHAEAGTNGFICMGTAQQGPFGGVVQQPFC
jgi:hypothetical protein